MTTTANHTDPGRFIVLTWCCVAAMVAYLQRTAIGVAGVQIREELGLSVVQFGMVMSGYYWTYALSQLPAGWVGQTIGPRWMLIVCVGASSLLTVFAALSPTGLVFAACWLCAGVAIAGIFPSCVQLFVVWFAPSARALPSGLLSSSMSVGGAISSALTGVVLARVMLPGIAAWRLVFLGFGCAGLLWAIGYALSNSGSPRDQTPEAPTEPLIDPTASSDNTSANTAVTRDDSLGDLLLDLRTWLICAQQFFRAAGYVFYATWFPEFLRMTRAVDTAAAGGLTSLPLIGVVIGGAIGGWFADFLEQVTGSRRFSRQVLGIGSHALCAGLILTAQFIADPTAATLVIALGSLVFALGASSAYAITMDLGGTNTATLFGLMNMCGNIGAAICPTVVGLLVTRIGWNPILYFFAALYAAAALCWLGLHPGPRTRNGE